MPARALIIQHSCLNKKQELVVSLLSLWFLQDCDLKGALASLAHLILSALPSLTTLKIFGTRNEASWLVLLSPKVFNLHIHITMDEMLDESGNDIDIDDTLTYLTYCIETYFDNMTVRQGVLFAEYSMLLVQSANACFSFCRRMKS